MSEQENPAVARAIAALSLDGPDANQADDGNDASVTSAPRQVVAAPTSAPAIPPEGGDFPDECNLFVGDLARAVTEDQLRDTFAAHGEVMNVEIKRDRYTHNSLGYGFVQFRTRAEAASAKKALHRVPIGNRAIRIGWAQKNTNLFVGDLDPSITTAQLREVFSKYGDIYPEETFVKGRNFGFVRFKHRVHAEAAKRQLDGQMIVENTKPIRIGWGDNNFQKSCVHVQFNLGEKDVMNEEVLRDAFKPFGNVTSVTLPRSNQALKGFGFVHFEDTDDGEEAATTAIAQLSGQAIGPTKVTVQCNFGKRQANKRQHKKMGHHGNPMYNMPMMVNLPGTWPGQPMHAGAYGQRMGPGGPQQGGGGPGPQSPYGQGGHDQQGQLSPMAVPMAYMYQGMPPNAYPQQMYMQGYGATPYGNMPPGQQGQGQGGPALGGNLQQGNHQGNPRARQPHHQQHPGAMGGAGNGTGPQGMSMGMN